MSSAKITLFTFARYMQQHEDDLFKNLTVPTGLNKDTLTENILLRGGEFEVIYSDPLFMQYAIGTWSKKWQRTMEKWLQALAINYNPLENYDRYENIQDTSTKTSNMDRTLDHQDETVINTQDLLDINTENARTINTQELRTLDTENKRTLDTDTLSIRNLMDEENRNLTDEETRLMNDTTTYDHDTEVERRVSAFDSSSYQPAEVTYNKDSDSDHNTVSIDYTGTDTFEHTGKDIFNHTGTEDNKQTGTDTMNNTGTDTLNNTGTDTMNNTGTERTNRTGSETTGHTGTISDEGGEDGFNDHVAHIHGNIGVTTSQQMLEAELDIDKWNIYEHITDLFLTEFVIPIYT